jgi:TadE-like protein
LRGYAVIRCSTDRAQHPGHLNDRGAAAVELALVLVPLFMLAFGIVEFSRVSWLKLQLTHNTRELTREIALHYDDPGFIGLDALVDDTMQDLFAPDVLAVTQVTQLDGCSIDLLGDTAEVELSQPVELNIPFVEGFSQGPVDVTAHAVMPCEG